MVSRCTVPAHVVDVDCSEVVRGHSEYLEREPVREDLRAVLAGEDRHEIDGRIHVRASRFSLPAPSMEGLPCD
jgi:hypothetical protein